MKTIAWYLVLAGFLCGHLHAATKQVVRVSLGMDTAPYVIPENNTGISLEILSAALEPEGIVIEPYYVPYQRRLLAYKDGLVDIASDVNQMHMANHQLSGYISDPAVEYQNIVISLSKNNLNIERISDLSRYSILAWQGAREILGESYKNAVDISKGYIETSDQKTQLLLLFSGRVDAIQMGNHIFYYWRDRLANEKNRKLGRNIDVCQQVKVHAVFGLSQYAFLFRDEALAKIFNRNLERLRNQGAYQRVIQKYTHYSPRLKGDSRGCLKSKLSSDLVVP